MLLRAPVGSTTLSCQVPALVGTCGKLAAGADIAAARHVDDAAALQNDRGAVIFGDDRRAGIADILAEIEGAQADAAAIDVKRAVDRVAQKSDIVDPASADIDERMRADDQIRQRRRADPRRHAGDSDAAAMRGERPIDGGGAAELDAAAVQHRQARALIHRQRIGAADGERAESE